MTVADHDASPSESAVSRTRAGQSQPISQHPLFPAIVALWFGAAFGVASLAIRPALLERLVSLTGIDSVLPFAAAPLGSTARILVALALTGLGALVGLIVARRLARPAPVHLSSRRIAPLEVAPEMAPEAALVADEAVADEVAETPLPRPVFAGGRPSRTEPHETTPDVLAAIAPQILDVAEFDLASFDGPLENPVAAASGSSPARGAFKATTAVSSSQIDAQDSASLGSRLFEEYTRNAPADDHAGSAMANETIAEPGLTPHPSVEPIDETPAPEAAWFAHELQSVNASAADAPAPTPTSMPAPMPAGIDAESRSAAQVIASAPLDELSPVQLLERLAIAIERRRKATRAEKQPAGASSAHPPEPELLAAERSALQPEMPASAPEAEPASPTFSPLTFVPLQSVPPMPQDSGSEAKAEREVRTASAAPMPGYGPPRPIGLTVAPAWRPSIEANTSVADDAQDIPDNDRVLEQGYSSLLHLSRQTTPQTRDASLPSPAPEAATGPALPPPRLFDAPGRSGAIDTERALRDALATLQRMSGAA
ncbi:hypothetical protein WSK_3033 [Novosphingobium sp. Rr 2-17]|uniref:hypothetical protein n=1 Tax=Novosphingobium sp. Rr 2-17 TaxID=555793 RepID=UPI000269AB85|nr:hypothetical protein [Novosphingobium sp. Rr 2-17]EIZ78414.1 hypothetical protein WSK_3033 [Novosphingobium sp. Rr 2-17]